MWHLNTHPLVLTWSNFTSPIKFLITVPLAQSHYSKEHKPAILTSSPTQMIERYLWLRAAVSVLTAQTAWA